MINVLYQSREFTPVERYIMTLSPKMVMVKNLEDGTILPVDGIMEYEDVDEQTGEVTAMVAILSGNVGYVAQSQTFKRSLKDIQACMGEGVPFEIEKISGETKSGRQFVNCALHIS